MKILSITTSSPICGVAILEDTKLIKEINLNNGLTHSETLMPIINQILNECSLTLNDIDLLGVDIGPGSFTGIRIGISTIKAFVDFLGKKPIGINSLEALKQNIKDNGVICSLIDARKENIYCEIFENIDDDYIIRRKPSFENIDNFLHELKYNKLQYPITFIGDGSLNYKDKILTILPNSKFANCNTLSAQNIGLSAFHNYTNNITYSIEPLYLRKTDAEQKFEERNAN